MGFPDWVAFPVGSLISGASNRVLEGRIPAGRRRHAEVENAIRDLKYGVGLNHMQSGRFAANPELAEGRLAGGPGDRA